MADRNTMILVNKEEADFLKPFYQIANTLFAEILTEEEERAAFIAQVEEAGLDVAKAKKLARRIIKYKWFTFFITRWEYIDALNQAAVFAYCTSEQGTPQEPIDLYPIEEHAAFYEAWQSQFNTELNLTDNQWIAALQDALDLTREHFYIDDTSAQTLLYIADIYQLVNELGITQTQRTRSTFSLPISKLWRQQQDIAKAASGRAINVNSRRKEPCIVKASITTKDHKPLEMPGLYKVIQTAIGNIMEDNPHIRPIILTPAQICKQIRLQDADDSVSKSDEEAVIAAMDSMIETPSIIDYSAQLQEHKKLNKQADYDYSANNVNLGYERGPLIMGKKIGVGISAIYPTWNGEPIKVAYKIFEPPVFYRYSHIVGQIVQVEAGLISATNRNQLPEAKKLPAIKGDLESKTMEYEILTRIKYMQTQTKYKTYDKRIKVDDILQAVYVHPTALTAAQRRTALKNIVLYLDLLVKKGEITGHTEIRGAKNKIIGYEIQLPARQKRRT